MTFSSSKWFAGLVVFVSGVLLVSAFSVSLAEAKTYKAKSGKSTRIQGFTSWNSDCSYKPVRLEVTRQPKHGKVVPRLEVARIGTILNGTSKCKGRKINKVFLYYTSKRGYKGKDAFRIRVRFGGTPQNFSYTINVK